MESELSKLFEDIDSVAEKRIAEVQIVYTEEKIALEKEAGSFGYGIIDCSPGIEICARNIEDFKRQSIDEINAWRNMVKEKAIRYVLQKSGAEIPQTPLARLLKKRRKKDDSCDQG